MNDTKQRRILRAATVALILGSAGAGAIVVPSATCTPPPSGMTAWYRAENNATDSTGTSTATLNGSVGFAAGKVGQAFSLPGTSPSDIRIAGVPDVSPAYSFDAWVFWQGNVNGSGHDAIVVKNDSANLGGSDSYGMFIANADNSFYNTLENQVYVSAAGAVPVNTWFHVAQTYDGTTARVYKNGQEVASFTGSRVPSTGNLGLGSRPAGAGQHHFHGLLDEVEFFDRVLSAAEVQAIFEADTTGKCKNQSCATPPPNMVSWYRAENDAKDSQGANDGALNGVTFSSGKVGQAFSVGASTVTVADSANLNFAATDSFTLDAWIFRTSSTSLQHILGKRSGCGGGNFYQLVIGGGGFDDAAIPLNAWTHIALTFNAGAVQQYVNGTAAAGNSLGGTVGTNSAPLEIGNSGSCDGFSGLIDEVEVFNRALSPTEIKGIFNAGVNGKCATCATPPSGMTTWLPGDGNGNDISGNGNNGTLQGGATANGNGIVGQAFSLDGASAFVEVLDSPGLNSPTITVDAWVFVNQNKSQIVVAKDNVDTQQRDYLIDLFPSGGQLNIEFALVNQAANGAVSATGGPVTLNTWHHLAGTYDGSRARVYVDGLLVGTSAAFGQTLRDSDTPLWIGRTNSTIQLPGAYFGGLIDEVEIFNRALSDAEIARIYCAGSRGKCRPATLDFGDAPASYGTLLVNDGARHTVGTLKLGSAIDAEADGQPSANADGDDVAGSPDDEDGVSFGAAFVAGTTVPVTVTVSGGPGELYGWVDFNGNGSWETSEQVFDGTSVVNGANALSIVVPATATTGTTYARFRLVAPSNTDLGIALVDLPTGFAGVGEVEDYKVTIALPQLTINDVSLNEGNAGTTAFNFTVTLTPAVSQTVTVNFATAVGGLNPATSGTDFVANSGTLTFTTGQTTKPVTVQVNGDTTVESDETFFVNLSGASGAAIGDNQGVGTIRNDDQVTGTCDTQAPGINLIDKSNATSAQIINAPKNKKNVIIGSPYNDTITSGDQGDCIDGRGGNDHITGGSGGDLLFGGLGDDTMDGGSGNDEMHGGEGKDNMIGGSGDDKMFGDIGDDTMDGGSGNDEMRGGEGNDKMMGGSGDDKMFGENGNDALDGGGNNDTLTGGPGTDSFAGGSGTDTCDNQVGETASSCEIHVP